MRKFLALAVCLMLLGTVTVNGTLAFSFDGLLDSLAKIFRSEPETSTELQIDTLIQVRSGNQLISASENDVLVPAHFDQDFDWVADSSATINGYPCSLWPEDEISGAVDKIIYVKNNSAEKDAYFRTAISVRKDVYQLLKFNLNLDSNNFMWTGWTDDGDYVTNVFTYKHKLENGKSSPPMMLQIAMDKSITNDQLKKYNSKMQIFKAKTVAIESDAFVKSDNTLMSEKEAVELLLNQNIQ